eukprot:362772-Chlamydomonas_euryale.AAC.13
MFGTMRASSCTAPSPRSRSQRRLNAPSTRSASSYSPVVLSDPNSAVRLVCGKNAPPTSNVVSPASTRSNSVHIHGVSDVGSSANDALSSPSATSASATAALAASSSALSACACV